jgi:2-hydroxycyclohexanecarboxyl-CoA dehydrogenase
MRGLRGKVAIVTGSGSGIGREIARRLAEEGAVVGVFDLNKAGADETVSAVKEAGGRAFSHRVDISDRAQVEAAVQAFEAEAGPTDILVNNAGWDVGRWFLDTDKALWDKVIAINLYGPLNMHQVVLRGMAERKSGKVVNMASDAGRVGSSQEAVYSACKGGIIAFTKTMAREMARNNIQLNVVCPGPTDTPLFAAAFGDSPRIAEGLKSAIPLKRLGRPTDYPGIVCFLASSDADFITGQTISVSGGLTMS